MIPNEVVWVQIVGAKYVVPIWHRRVKSPVGGHYTACGKRITGRRARLADSAYGSPDEQDKCRVCLRARLRTEGEKRRKP